MWNYYWGYTAAQVELAIADGPMIVYKKDKKKGANAKPSSASVQRAALDYEQRKKEGKTNISVDLSEFM